MQRLTNQKSKNVRLIWFISISLFVLAIGFGLAYSRQGRSDMSAIKGQTKEITSKKTTSPVDKAETKTNNVSLFFAGDAMLDRYIRDVSEKKGASFLTEKMEQIFLEVDAVIFNLEGPVTENKSVSQNTAPGEKGHMNFTFDKETSKTFLKTTRASAIFLGNNHILNFGKTSLSETESFLKENGVDYFVDIKGKSESLIREIDNKKVAFIAFNQFLGEGAKSVVMRIEELEKNNDFVVLYAHWGTEYAREENEKQREWAHDFIDAGADLVIGSHPHVVQPVEVYKNKAIFYSLGNFVFDQYFSAETMEGLAVTVSVRDDVLDFYLSPLSLNRDGATTLSEGKKKDSLLFWLSENSTVSAELKSSLKEGYFQIKDK